MNITREEQQVIHENLARLVQGVEVWNNWRTQNREIDIDLRRINLEGVHLEGVNFSRANLSRADLSRADLKFANLRFADLCGTNLSGANLRFAKLYNADLSAVNLSGAHLIEADFRSANLSCADLSEATLSGANLSDADLSWANLTDSSISGVKWNPRKMRGKYMGIRGIDSSYGNALFKRAAADQDYLDTLENHWKGKWQTYLFKLWGLIDYGRSMERVVAIACIIMIIFGLTYSIFPGLLGLDCVPGAQGCNRHSLFTPFYFSIVTFTTLGFGDITPKTFVGELIVSLEVILGYAVLGLLISVLADKVVRRS
ncbi:MAG: hypothetical protein HC852_11475 [Acaryochloridaceae cyanobacterium RU_4_10]|nr:hypothetical protein [Acaryochloridaceae cyanobacterium RU_4_10]